jgi:hypothetical protein
MGTQELAKSTERVTLGSIAEGLANRAADASGVVIAENNGSFEILLSPQAMKKKAEVEKKAKEVEAPRSKLRGF